MYTLLYLKWIIKKNLLYSVWNSAQCYMAAWMGGEFGGDWIHVYVWLSLFTVHPKLSQHSLSAIPQYKMFLMLKKKLNKLKKRWKLVSSLLHQTMCYSPLLPLLPLPKSVHRSCSWHSSLGWALGLEWTHLQASIYKHMLTRTLPSLPLHSPWASLLLLGMVIPNKVIARKPSAWGFVQHIETKFKRNEQKLKHF